MKRTLTGIAALALVVGTIVVSAGPVSSAAAPSATWAWTSVRFADEGCVLGKIDLATGALTQLPGTPSNAACVQDLAAGPDGSVWGIDQERRGGASLQDFSAPQAATPISLVRFDTTTGEAASVKMVDIAGSDGEAGLANGGLAITADGTVWAQIVDTTCADGDYVCLYTVNPTTGVATQVGPSNLFQTYMDGLAICGTGPITLVGAQAGPPSTTIPVPQANGQDLHVGTVSATTGAVTKGPDTLDTIIGYDCGGASTGYALLGSEPLIIGSTPQSTEADLVRFDPATGATTAVAAVTPTDADVALLAIPVGAPPAPSTTTTTAAAAQPATVTPRFTG